MYLGHYGLLMGWLNELERYALSPTVFELEKPVGISLLVMDFLPAEEGNAILPWDPSVGARDSLGNQGRRRLKTGFGPCCARPNSGMIGSLKIRAYFQLR